MERVSNGKQRILLTTVPAALAPKVWKSIVDEFGAWTDR